MKSLKGELTKLINCYMLKMRHDIKWMNSYRLIEISYLLQFLDRSEERNKLEISKRYKYLF